MKVTPVTVPVVLNLEVSTYEARILLNLLGRTPEGSDCTPMYHALKAGLDGLD